MKYLIVFSFILLVACNQNSNNNNDVVSEPSQTINGKALFTTLCASCHKTNEKMIGPALQGTFARWPDRDLLYDYVRNSMEVIGRNAYAKKLFDEYKQYPMTAFPQLKNEEIEAILKYCDEPQQ